MTLSKRSLSTVWLALALMLGYAAPVVAQDSASMQARTALEQGRYAEAIATLTRVIEQSPEDADARILRGQAYEARRQFDDAIRDYEAALRARPGDPMAETGLNRSRRSIDTRTAAAAETLGRQVEANPTNLSLRLQFADALRAAGRLPESAEQYGYYLEQTQGTPDVVTSYLVVLAGMNDNARGAATAERYLNVYPSSSDLWMRLGYFRLWQGQFGPAEEAFERAIELNARNRQAQQGLEQTAQARANSRSAPSAASTRIDQLEAQLRRNADQDDVRFQLVDALIASGRHVEAFGQLQVLSKEHARSERWQQRFQRVDRALPARAQVHQIDRLTFRLTTNPDDLQLRYSVVDALAADHRYVEAQNILLAGSTRGGASDASFTQRVRQLEEARLAHARAQQNELVRRLQENPGDIEAARSLAMHLPVLLAVGELQQDVRQARSLYEQLLAARPNDHEVRFAYVQFLTQADLTELALQHARQLIQADPDDPRYIAQYLYAAAQEVPPPQDAFRVAQRGLEIAPNDPDLLLAVVTFYASASFDGVDYLDQAEQLLRRAQARGADPREVAAREEVITRGRRYRIIADARQAARGGQYRQAISGIEEYYRVTGERMPREVRLELAQYHFQLGDEAAAIRLIEQAQQERFSGDAQLVLARHYFDAGDYTRALAASQMLVEREPQNIQGLLLYGDALRESTHHAEARRVYQRALAADDPELRLMAQERIAFVDRMRTGDGVGVLLAPRTDFIWAGGDGIHYQRFAPGVDAQLALPALQGVTLLAGYQAHHITGSDVVIPALARPIPGATAHQFGGGALIDLTPTVNTPLGVADHTNRIHLEAGAYSYPTFTNAITGQLDSRTAPFWLARYMHHTPGEYEVSVGVRQTEGAIELWAPIGPSIDLRLLQADIRGSAAPMDSLFKLSGRLAFNRVTHERTLGRFALTGERVINNGYSIDLQAGYRVVRNLYAGVNYHRLQYEQPSPFYFTPTEQPYQLGELFLEYETLGAAGRPYFRVLGAVGTVTGGFFTQRVEADLIYPLVTNLALGLNLRASQSARGFADGSFSGYSIFVLSGALFVGL